MALHRGIQSAIFYYLSCAPCTGYSYRKKRRKEATRGRAEKQQLEMDHPGHYRHPSPFATNPHWQAEIDLGPAPPATRRKKENQRKSMRGRTSGGNESNIPSSVNLSLVPGETNDSTSNLRRYQREDEELWGPNLGPRVSRISGLEGSIMNGKGTISRPATARTTTTDRTNTTYYSVNNPPISDLHPAIVTRIDSREDAMWMLQPPPTARVMSGADRPDHIRQRSDSGSSRLSSRRGDHTPLSRQVSHRIIDEKIRSGELLPAISLSRDNSSRASNRPRGHRQDHDGLPTRSAENLSSDDAHRSRRRRRPPPINVSEDSNHSEKTVIRRHTTYLDPDNAKLNPRRALSPVRSENASFQRSIRDSSASRSREHSVEPEPSDNRQPAQRPALSGRDRQDSSLNVLQELVPTSLLNVRRPVKQPSFEARIELPSIDSAEEMELLGSGKAAFESWYESRDIDQFPQWVSDRTRRDVSSRWSVDF